MRAIVTGGASGLGGLIAQELRKNDFVVHEWDIANGVDVANRISVMVAANHFFGSELHVLVNCAGVNVLRSISDLNEYIFDHVMAVNAKGIFLVTQALLSVLAATNGTVCNIISNASHVPMTNSLAYNASKAAAMMMTKQMARELWRDHHITVFGVSPNRMAGTGMSASVDQSVAEMRNISLQEVAALQSSKMPIGEETDPSVVAEFVAFLLAKKERHKYLHGCVIPYGD